MKLKQLCNIYMQMYCFINAYSVIYYNKYFESSNIAILQSFSLLLKCKGDDTCHACRAAGPVAISLYPERIQAQENLGKCFFTLMLKIPLVTGWGLVGSTWSAFLVGGLGKIATLLRVTGKVHWFCLSTSLGKIWSCWQKNKNISNCPPLLRSDEMETVKQQQLTENSKH